MRSKNQCHISQNLIPYTQFSQQYYQDAPMALPLGFTLGKVDSIVQVETDSLGNSSTSTSRLLYENGRMAYTYIEGEEGMVGYVADTLIVPEQPNQNGLDSTLRSSQFILDFFGSQIDARLQTRTLVDRVNGVVQSKVYYNSGTFIPSSTVTESFTYSGDSMLTVISELTETPSPIIVIDSTIYMFDVLGQLTSCTQYSEGFFDELQDPPMVYSAYDITYSGSGEIEVQGFREDSTSNAEVSILLTNEVASASIVTTGAFGDSTSFFRTDDDSNPLLRTYLLMSEAGESLEYTFYYENRSSAVQETQLVPGRLIGSNPIVGGQTLSLQDLPDDTRLELIGINGQHFPVDAPRQGALQFTWPNVPAGMYVLVASAPGYASRGRKLIGR